MFDLFDFVPVDYDPFDAREKPFPRPYSPPDLPGKSYKEGEIIGPGTGKFPEGMENLPGPRSDPPDAGEFVNRLREQWFREQMEKFDAQDTVNELKMGIEPNPIHAKDINYQGIPPLPPERPLVMPKMPRKEDFKQGGIAGMLGGGQEVQQYIRSHPSYEEWQSQPMGPIGEATPPESPIPGDEPESPLAGARNLYQSQRSRSWDPRLAGRTGRYWSLPIDRINELSLEGMPTKPEYHGPPEWGPEPPWTPPPKDAPPESPQMEQLRRIFGPKGYGPGTGNTGTIYSKNDLGGK